MTTDRPGPTGDGAGDSDAPGGPAGNAEAGRSGPATDGGRSPAGRDAATVNRPTDAAPARTVATAPSFRSDGVLARVLAYTGDARLTGLVSSGCVVLAVAVLAGHLVGTALTVLSLVGGFLLAAGLYGLTSDRLAVLALAGVLFTPAALLLGAVVGVAVAFGLQSPVAAGHFAELTVALTVVGGFAAVLTAVPLEDEAVLATAFPRFVAAIVPLTLVQIGVVSVVAWDAVGGALAGLVLDSPEPLLAVGRTLLAPRGSVALLSALVYVVVLLVLLRRIVDALPLASLFPTRQRPSVRSRIDRATRRLDQVTASAIVAATVVGLGALATGLARPPALARALPGFLAGPVVWLLTTVWLRVVVVVVLGVLVAILVGERLRRRVRRSSETDLLRKGMPAVGVVCTAVVAAVAVHLAVSPAWVLARVPPSLQEPATGFLAAGGLFPAVLVATFAAVVAAFVTFVAFTFVAASPVLPNRGLGPALSSGAAFGLAVVLVLFQGLPLLAFAAAALALVAWDTGEFAIGLREELPTDAATTRGELVHVGASLGVGLLAVVGAVLVELFVSTDLLVPSVPDTALAAGAITLAFATVVVLLSALRD